jgi:ABC-type multidrug transport system fused ATPase/permease subunit
LPTEFHSNIAEIEGSTGRTSAFVIYSISALIGGLTCAFISGAVFAACMLACIPYTLIAGGYQNLIIEKEVEQDEIVYRKSGADAEQALGSIKLVKAFGQEKIEIDKYNEDLKINEKTLSRYSVNYGFSFGFLETLRYVLPCYFLFLGGVFIISGVRYFGVSLN